MQLIVIFILLTQACLSQTVKDTNVIKTNINFSDSLGKKQGKWIIQGKMRPENKAYAPEQIIEEGYYKNNRKDGLWKEYYASGVLKYELTFVNGRPAGYAIMYHETGCKAEEGMWKNNRWTGLYKAYDKNEKLINAFDFKDSGKREGRRTYCNTL